MIRVFTENDREYVIESHYKIYNKEYNYNETFKEFIAKSVDDYMKNSCNSRECIWILEVNGQENGSIAITKVNEEVAQLRLFLINPHLRGGGYGKKLVETAIEFAEKQNYKVIKLCTNRDLKAARSLYEKYGFQIVDTTMKVLSDQEVIEEIWELKLS
ncbi:GNAT family N-acetyltransferase [Bacillus sp. DX1.1]|uniref:GNAT family N-acetyltransferase n=1 Tax=unclassified Bacillus (in: firmicutes) TaxID=185979 RepID=UPI00257107F9|nr:MULTISPECIES: GNAT family N-acetyltransferase [unclassified Bacillus (in: firmicutes)]MDM5155212.1 GNAT family N-acetyltransferase [Bacillus sp. DX1.1]WJE79532.1 GNAT family N-acetyltransferase [Bacillus sp. DX3.1]